MKNSNNDDSDDGGEGDFGDTSVKKESPKQA